MESATIATVVVALLGSSTLVAVIQWAKDRRKDSVSVESLSVSSLVETVTLLRSELREVRAELAAARAEIERLERSNMNLLLRLSRTIHDITEASQGTNEGNER